MMITALIARLIPTALAAGTSTFSDVPASHTCYEDIQWAADNGIVNGYNGKFNPDGKITVEQYCTMLSRSVPENEQDTGDLGAAKDSMLYHLRRVVRRGWTGYGAELELQKDRTIKAGNAWNYALTATGTQVYSGRLYGANPNTNIDGMRTAKELGLATKDADATEIITRAQAVSIIHAALTNTKVAQEPPIVTEMKGVVKDLPQSAINDFYADMAKVPEPIRKAFIADGWKICFDTGKINEYSDKSGIYGIGGMTDYSEKTIYLATARSLLHEMGHYYQEKIKTTGIDRNVYSTFETIRSKEKWSGTLYSSNRQTNGAEFFADAFSYYVTNGIVRADPAGTDAKAKLQSQKYFDDLAAKGWLFTR